MKKLTVALLALYHSGQQGNCYALHTVSHH